MNTKFSDLLHCNYCERLIWNFPAYEAVRTENSVEKPTSRHTWNRPPVRNTSAKWYRQPPMSLELAFSNTIFYVWSHFPYVIIHFIPFQCSACTQLLGHDRGQADDLPRRWCALWLSVPLYPCACVIMRIYRHRWVTARKDVSFYSNPKR